MHPLPRHASNRSSATAEEEAGALLARARSGAALDWDVFSDAWFCVVRRVVLGDAARDDRSFTRLHERLRAYANLAFVQAIRHTLRDRFLTRLNQYLDDPEPGSLAAIMGGTPTTPHTAPDHQPPHWMFAADPAGMTVFRTLALLRGGRYRERQPTRLDASNAIPSTLDNYTLRFTVDQ